MTIQDTAKNIENKLSKVSNSKSANEIEDGVDEMKDGAKNLKSGLRNIKEGVENLAQLTVEDAKEKYGTLEKNLGDYLQQHPLKSLGIVLAAGFALSKLIF